MPDLGKLLNPRSVVVIGASEQPTSVRGHCCETILHHRFTGKVFFVSRSSQSVYGHRTYRRIADLPEVPDLALLLTPAAATSDVLRQCVDVGIRAAIIFGSGFAEERGQTGQQLQAEVAAIARDHDLALAGPNSEGLADTETGLAATFSPVLRDMDPLPDTERLEGPRVNVIAQSGALGFGLFDLAWSRGLAVQRVITTGNEACLSMADYLDYHVDEGRTDALLLFVEGFGDGRRFLTAAGRCREAGIPIVVLRVGRSRVGQRQAASHTGALAADDRVVGDLMADAAIIETVEMDEAVECAGLAARLRHILPAGPRMGICSSSGGGAGLLADLCDSAGLDVPELEPATRSSLDQSLPSYGSSVNPIDATASGIRALGYAGITETLSNDPNIDGVIVVASGRTVATVGKEVGALKSLASTCSKPIVFWSYTSPIPEFLDVMQKCGLPVTTKAGAIVKTLKGLSSMRVPDGSAVRHSVEPPSLTPGIMTEASAYPLLEGLGLEPGPWRVVRSAEEAASAVDDIQRLVALKVQSAAIPHKTEAKAIRLNVSVDDVVDAFEEIIANARDYAPHVSVDGVVVQAMAEPGVEMILGALSDPVFGPLVMIGIGGTFAELLDDTVFAEAPVTEVKARNMIDRLRGRAILDGVRGGPPADKAALCRAIAAVSTLAAAPGLRELDLNPVFVHRNGLTVADALIVVEAT